MIHKYVVKGQGGTEPTNWSLGYYNKNGLNCFALFCWSNRTILFWIISISLRDTLFLYACFTFIATLCKLQKHWNHFHRFLVSTYFYFDFLRWRIHTTTDQWSDLFYRDGKQWLHGTFSRISRLWCINYRKQCDKLNERFLGSKQDHNYIIYSIIKKS